LLTATRVEFTSVGFSVVSKLDVGVLVCVLPVGLDRSNKGYIPEMCGLGCDYC
jgi:hypothetical protein